MKKNLKYIAAALILLFWGYSSPIALFALGFTAITYYFWQKPNQMAMTNQMQAEFTQQLLLNTEEERGRLANDLHDSISHELLSLKRGLTDNPTDINQKIEAIINNVRQFSRNIHPLYLDKIGLAMSIETLCEQYMEHQSLFISYDIEYNNELSQNAELQVFRIIEEALNNIVKYADCVACKVHIKKIKNTLELVIQDNGKGFDVIKTLNSNKAYGLHSIIQRAEAIGGIAMISASSKGTIIKINIT